MFYDLNLLCPKRKGKFAIIWLAATRGISYVKTSVDKVNIPQVCIEILQFVMSDSRSPRHRLSLYLSAKLLYGTVLVYYQQVKTLESQIIWFSTTIKRPIFKCQPEVEEEKKRKRKTTKPRKPKVVVTVAAEDIQIDEHLRDVPQLQEPNQNVTDAIHITLPEEQSTRIHINDAELFGDEGQIDLQLAQLQDITRFLPPSDTLPIPPTVPQEERTVQEKRLIETVEEVEQSPSKRRRTEIRPVSPAVHVRELGVLSPDRTLMPPPQSPARRSDRISTHPEQVYPRDAPSPRRRRSRRSGHSWNRLFVATNSEMGSFNLSDISLRSSISSLFSTTLPQIRDVENRSDIIEDLLENILRGVSHTEEDIREVANVASPSSSRRMRSRARNQQADAAAIEITEPELVPNISRIPDVEDQEIPDVPIVPSPRMSRVEPVQSAVAPVESLDDIRQQRVYTSTPIDEIQTEAKRHSLLLNCIRQLFEEIQGPLTLDIICEPLNRDNVARTFNGLLHLHAQRYIILKSANDSTELKEVYPGPRL